MFSWGFLLYFHGAKHAMKGTWLELLVVLGSIVAGWGMWSTEMRAVWLWSGSLTDLWTLSSLCFSGWHGKKANNLLYWEFRKKLKKFWTWFVFYYYLFQITFFFLPLNESVGVCCAELFFLWRECILNKINLFLKRNFRLLLEGKNALKLH